MINDEQITIYLYKLTNHVNVIQENLEKKSSIQYLASNIQLWKGKYDIYSCNTLLMIY
jgi:hypothetical protein